ncbi:hypothetical protein BKI52_08270 [marine bacterium AO1-C]|nr:hypothetical protein BKI52_08270 [marine bacterium AO1-C]
MHQQFIDTHIISAQGQVISQNTNTIIFDDSFDQVAQIEASLQAFNQEITGAKALLLADLSEDIEVHQQVGKVVADYAPELVIFHGKVIQQALVHNPKAYYFPDKFSLHNWLADRKFQNTHVLILGGKALKIETVLQFI